jgi:nicotinate-nucleotide adenylyltransferase
MNLKLGLLGGTFDPPHAGHVAAARWARDRFGLDGVELVPAFLPPHKPERPLSSPFHRHAMTVLATLGEARIRASFQELARGGISYAIETLRETRAALPDARIFFILGTDQFAEIATWREPRAIVEEFDLIVARRPGTSFDETLGTLPGYVTEAVRGGRIQLAAMDPVDLSSTEIRSRVSAGQPISQLVTPSVEDYIHTYGLYRPGG